tara:strand:+ start:354 stop:656 length:303 start_codon:yes stop_codon:yes gene_type:complete
MVTSHSLSFDILSDPGNTYAAELGLRFHVPPNIRSIYEGFKINLAQTNGDDSWTLPVPSRIIVEKGGTIFEVEADPDYTVRPEPRATVDSLLQLQAKLAQ